eukprot:TRINITY_DN11637_c1_g3_i5.p1 TRINITY_DN11637_c1_g3~~TRINITY_DN11637_c1_g3_i5.p1  ORF type:complete len:278 (+),score=6.04 TRINITY_DN11637_c1_g3_i5:66-899(+)
MATRLLQRRLCTSTASHNHNLPGVTLLMGDAFSTDSFQKISLDPATNEADQILRAAEAQYWEKGPNRHQNLAGWKPLSGTVDYLTCACNFKVISWSRHPLDTSKMVYTLLSSATGQEPDTILPHYHTDRLKEHWAVGENIPLYYKDVQGHSAHYRYTPDFTGQPSEYDDPHFTSRPESAPCSLPEMFALIVGIDEEWSSVKSNPPSALQPFIDEAMRSEGPGLPVTKMLNLLVSKYGCRIESQTVSNNDLKKITYIMENPNCEKQPRVPREGRASSA